jgi:hypothetical protein
VDLERVRRGLARLKETDPSFERFGASAHGYALNPPLPESEVAALERWYGVRLPEDYRAFVTTLGNGGAGPFYGLFRLGEMDDGFGFAPWSKVGLVGHLGRAFNPARGEDDPIDGALPLCHRGCALRDWLVVTGEAAGKVWLDATADGKGLTPLTNADGSAMSFEDWYLAWVEA